MRRVKAVIKGVAVEYEIYYGHPRPVTVESQVDLINYGIRCWNMRVNRLQPDYIKRRLETWDKKSKNEFTRAKKDLQVLQQTTGQVCLVGLPPSLPKAKVKKKKQSNGNPRSKPTHD